MIPPGWPAALGEFRAFGSELSTICVGRRHKQIVGNKRKVIVHVMRVSFLMVARWGTCSGGLYT